MGWTKWPLQVPCSPISVWFCKQKWSHVQASHGWRETIKMLLWTAMDSALPQACCLTWKKINLPLQQEQKAHMQLYPILVSIFSILSVREQHNRKIDGSCTAMWRTDIDLSLFHIWHCRSKHVLSHTWNGRDQKTILWGTLYKKSSKDRTMLTNKQMNPGHTV